MKLSKADNGLLSFPISEDDLVKADVENSTQSILDASEEDVEYESKDSYEEKYGSKSSNKCRLRI